MTDGILSIGGLTVCGVAIVEAIGYWGFGREIPGWSALPIAVIVGFAVIAYRRRT